MKKNPLILLFVSVAFCCWSQDNLHLDIIDGPANIREKPNGKLLFELYDNSAVTSTVLKNNWYNIGLFVKVNNIKSKSYLNEGDLIFNINNEKIGIVINKTPIHLKRSESDIGFIFGYTFKNNIKKIKSPEYVLEKLVEENAARTKEEFNYLLSQYHFELYGRNKYLIPGIEMYTISESILYDITPTFRISLLFKDNRIVAVVHTRKLNIICSEGISLIGDQKFTLIDKCLDEQYVKKLRNSLIRFFEKAD